MNSPLTYFTTVLVVGVAAQWLAWRMRIPAIIVLLLSGFALGQFIDAEAMIPRELLFPAVSLAVAVILFEGGMSLKFREFERSRRSVIHLCTVGVVLAWAATALAAKLVFESWEVAALTGALFVVTGPTVIVPLLRAIRPKSQVGAVLKWEGIVNDPIGAVLAVLVFETVILNGTHGAASGFAWGMFKTLLISICAGGTSAWALIQLLKRHWIPDYLESAVILAAVLLAFVISNRLQEESGLAAVTLLGVVLANQRAVRIQHVIEFKENLVILLVSVLFIVLASRMRLAAFRELGWAPWAFLAMLIVVIRPLSIYLSTIGTALTHSERAFLAGVAPRGIVAAAVASVFALEIQRDRGRPEAGAPARAAVQREIVPVIRRDAQKLVPVTFLIIFGTVTVYGLTAAPLAKSLNLSDTDPQGILFAGAEPFVRDLADAVQKEGYSVLLVDTNYAHIAAARMQGLPVQSASILSEYVLNEPDLSGIGRLLAMTPNNEVNSLAVRQFAELFGRANLFQLALSSGARAARGAVADKLTGRILFREGLTHSALAQRYAAGARVKKTTLSEEFDRDDLKRMYGESAVVLMTIDDRRHLAIATAENELVPEPGQTVLCLVDPRAETAAEN